MLLPFDVTEARSVFFDEFALFERVKAAFPDSKAVNEALRLLTKAAKPAQELQRAS